MPIRETSTIPSADDVHGLQYLVFYSSRDEDGRMWCPVGWPLKRLGAMS
jgi:hypothetical protein